MELFQTNKKYRIVEYKFLTRSFDHFHSAIRYKVQVRVLLWWFTITSFDDIDMAKSWISASEELDKAKDVIHD